VTITNIGEPALLYSISPAIVTKEEEKTKCSHSISHWIRRSNWRSRDGSSCRIKGATQTSIYLYHSIVPVAGYAVDGNTDGYFLNQSTTHTKLEYKQMHRISTHNLNFC
jgi:hypothetical protein